MKLDGAVFRNADEILRRELQHESHDADLDLQLQHCFSCLRGFKALKLKNLNPLFLRRDFQRIGPGAWLLGRAEHAGDMVAAREQRLEHGLAEILLADDGDFHQAVFFGGRLKAPALFRVEIFSF